MAIRWSLVVLLAAVAVNAIAEANNTADANATAAEILDAAGVRGGLVVHLGCGAGSLTAALRTNERYVVHGLDRSTANVDKAREAIAARGLYGGVSVSQLKNRRLPYADNMVKLIVMLDDEYRIPHEELLRALAPGGVVIGPKSSFHIPQPASTIGDKYVAFTKPFPPEIDEWTHWLHGPDGNAVAHDRVVGPPRRMQWTANPLWSRSHNLVYSVSAMVSANGRLFYIVDDAPAGMSGDSPDKWSLAARDAFSGVELWRLPIADWGWKAWSWRWEGRYNQPKQITRRLVANGDTVYATLGFNASLTALDAATGEILKTYEGTRFTDEILYKDGILIVSINHEALRAANLPKNSNAPNDDPELLKADPPTEKSVAAIDAVTGKTLWSTGPFIGTSTKTGGLERITQLLLAAKGEHVYVLDQDRVVALHLESGRRLWETPRPEVKRYTERYYHLMSDMCTLVATDEAVLLCQLEPIQKRIGWGVIKASLTAYAPENGEVLWTQPAGNWGHFVVPDVFVTDGLAWVHDSEEMTVNGFDLLTGQKRRSVSTGVIFSNGHHHRCYRNKATDRYLMTGYRGFEFIDWEADTADLNHWVRGACSYGGMPCNGMVYATPHPCSCYMPGKLNGLIALAPEGSKAGSSQPIPDSSRLLKGPIYDSIVSQNRSAADDVAWPTYRHDPDRSGSTVADIPGDLKLKWTGEFTGAMSAPVAGGGKVFAASSDTHEVHALDAATGRAVWSYRADGRVNTPPTLYRNLVLFGCRNGWIYCLRASDGKLAWRFLAAFEERLVGAFGRIESAWPTHGGVLIQDDRAYVVAGRSSFLDNGIMAWCLDPVTGAVLEQKLVDDEQSMIVDTGGTKGTNYGVIADVLTAEGKGVYMRDRLVFGEGDGKPNWGNRFSATAGMLDDSWFNRTYCILDGTQYGENLVYDDGTAYAIRAFTGNQRAHVGFTEAGQANYTLTAAIRPDPGKRVNSSTKGRLKWPTPKEYKWTRPISPRIRAMALAEETLVCVGTPDTLDPEEPWAAYEGKRGGVLLAVSTENGETLCELEFDGGPVLNGIAIADTRVYITTNDGRVLCFGS